MKQFNPKDIILSSSLVDGGDFGERCTLRYNVALHGPKGYILSREYSFGSAIPLLAFRKEATEKGLGDRERWVKNLLNRYPPHARHKPLAACDPLHGHYGRGLSVETARLRAEVRRAFLPDANDVLRCLGLDIGLRRDYSDWIEWVEERLFEDMRQARAAWFEIEELDRELSKAFGCAWVEGLVEWSREEEEEEE